MPIAELIPLYVAFFLSAVFTKLPALVTQLRLKGNRIQPIHGRFRELFRR
jgi:hypothetical protein